MKANIIKIQLYLYVKWWTYTQATCVDNTKTPETFNCIHGRKKWANIDKSEVLLGCLRQVRALHLQSLTFKSLWLENCLALYQERRLTCVYLLTVVDQKNPISRHRREEKAYKNTSFTSLIRSYEVTLPGVKLNLSYIRKKISNSDSSYFVWRKERRRRKRQKKTTCCMRNKPHCALHASFLFFLSDTQGVVFLFAFFFWMLHVPACSAPTGAGGVWGSLAVLSLRGTMRAGSQDWQARRRDSQTWVTSERSKGEHLSKRCVNLLW